MYNKRLRVVYVSGKYRASNPRSQEENVAVAWMTAKQLWEKGFVAICPHMNTKDFETTISTETIIKGDCELVKRCDAVLMLQGWEVSIGAVAEKTTAEENNVPVFYNINDLEAYFKQKGR